MDAATFAHNVATRRDVYDRQVANAATAARRRYEQDALNRYDSSIADANREALALMARGHGRLARALHRAWVTRAHKVLADDLTAITVLYTPPAAAAG